MDLQTCSQAQGASWTHICWEEVQRSPREGTLASQGKTFKTGQLEEEQHSIPQALPLNFVWLLGVLYNHPSLIAIEFRLRDKCFGLVLLNMVNFASFRQSNFVFPKLVWNVLSHECFPNFFFYLVNLFAFCGQIAYIKSKRGHYMPAVCLNLDNNALIDKIVPGFIPCFQERVSD